jgi:hypothetical protein
MKTNPLALSVLALVIGSTGIVVAQPFGAPQGPPPPAYAQEGGWDAPPAEFREFRRKGFHDGVEGARKDFDNHREMKVENREEYRHPHVPPSAQPDYREGFRRGYEVAARHLMGG